MSIKNYQISGALADGYKIGLNSLSANPAADEGKGFIFAKEIDGYAELHYLDDYGSVIQFTQQGVLVGGSSNLDAYVAKSLLDAYAEKTLLDAYALDSDLDLFAEKTLLDSYATASVVDGYALTSSLSTYADKSLLDSYATPDIIDGYAQLVDGYLPLEEKVSDPIAIANRGHFNLIRQHYILGPCVSNFEQCTEKGPL